MKELQVCLPLPDKMESGKVYTASVDFKPNGGGEIFLDTLSIVPQKTYAIELKASPLLPLFLLGLVIAWTAWDFFRRKTP